MANSAPIARRWKCLPAAALAIVVAAGCGEPEKIHSYSVPKETPPEVAKATPAAAGEPTDRMLAAIVPSGDQAYFFKVVGSIPAIEKHEKEINEFFTSLAVPPGDKPKWHLADGWKEIPSNNAMRLLTIIIPSEGKPLEIAVSALPWSGTPEGMLSNVNRWRGQMHLPDTDAAGLADDTHEAKAGDTPITIVDLRGRFSGGMTPPFAGGAGGAPFAGGPVGAASRAAQDASPSPNLPPGHPSVDSSLPPGHPPIDSQQATSPPSAEAPSTPADPALKFTVPDGWKTLPATEFRKAAFAVGDADHGALITLIPFPLTEGSLIADPLANVNRWRREVGLPDVKQDELAKVIEPTQVDGKMAAYVRAVPDSAEAAQSKAQKATLAAMAKQGEKIWFIKLTGDRGTVVAQEDAFKSFLKSLRFVPGGESSDGHK